tara:strand:- start:79 stop:927 length:849 start_codon:yes stop_codon:yes gene_type:complete
MMASVDGTWWLNEDGTTREDPVYAFVDAVTDTRVGIAIAFLAILTMISGALSGVLASSRFLFAMARDNLLPQSLEDVNIRYETPHWAIIITGLTMAVCLVVLPVKDVAKLASGFQIMVFMMINLCLIVLRSAVASHDWYNPTFKSPFYPWLQIWGIFAGGVLVYMMGSKAIIGGFGAVVIGLATYSIYGSKHYLARKTPYQTFREMFSNTELKTRLAAFHAADIGASNHLTLSEFISAMKALKLDFSNDEYRVLFHKADTDNNGVIDIDEFLSSVEQIDDEE